MAALTDATSWDCHSGHDQNDVKLYLVEDDDLLAKVICNCHWVFNLIEAVKISFTLMYQNPVKRIQTRSQMMSKCCGNCFCGLGIAQRGQTHRGQRLSEPYRRNVNNRELNHVWISSYSLLCKRYGSSFLLIKDWFLYYCLISLQRLIGDGLYL